jgi:hypothetical protein
MATLYTANIQRDAALLVFQRTNTELSANQKAALDDTWTTGDPGGAAGYAEAEIRQYSNFLYAEGLDTIPSAWARWFVYEIGAALAPQWNPDRAPAIRALRDDYKQAALTTYTRIASNYSGDSDEQNSKTWLGIRRSVMANCLHQPTPVFAAPELIDGAIRNALHLVWHEAEWSWQIMSDKSFTITNSGGRLQNINTDPDLRAIRSLRLWYDSSNAGERKYLKYVSADEMSHMVASQLADGQPDFFRLIRTGREIQIQLERTPDKTYTIRGEFVRRMTDLGTLEGVSVDDQQDSLNSIILSIPDEFTDIIERLALGHVLKNRGRREGLTIAEDAKRDLERLVERDALGEPLHEDSKNESRSIVYEQMTQGEGYTAGGGI